MKRKYFFFGIAIFVLIIVTGLIVFFYPIPDIVEDRPLLEKWCEIQPFSNVGGCGYLPCNDETDYVYEMLEHWSGYNGCNESTKGYNGKGAIDGSQLKCCTTVVLT